MILLKANLRMFDNTNVTTDSGLTNEMKTYYSDYLIDLAEPLLVHDQFGQKHPIPKGKGKTIEFRKYDSLPKALTPLTEGVTPAGQKLSMSVLTASVAQYGGYVELSDVLLLTAIDNNQVEAVKLLASQAGRTLDTITREVLNGGTNVQFGDGFSSITQRCELVGGDATPANNHYLDVRAIRTAVRTLKLVNAPMIKGDYVGIIHPDVADDIMDDDNWRLPHTYQDTSNIYSNEIGKIHGVRFVESTEAKVWNGADLASNSRTLTVNGAVSASATTITFDGGTVEADALIGRKITLKASDNKQYVYTITDNTATQLTITPAAVAIADNTVIYPGEGGKEGRAVYSTLVMGANAYGVTEVTGGGLTYISKQLGSAGSADPLDQRSSCGWKAIKCAERLIEQYMVRIETTSKFEAASN